MNTPSLASPPVTIKVDALRRRAAQEGLTTDTQIAERLLLHRITVWRLLDGATAPGPHFIAAVLETFPDLRFADVFQTTWPVAYRRVAA